MPHEFMMSEWQQDGSMQDTRCHPVHTLEHSKKHDWHTLLNGTHRSQAYVLSLSGGSEFASTVQNLTEEFGQQAIS